MGECWIVELSNIGAKQFKEREIMKSGQTADVAGQWKVMKSFSPGKIHFR